MRHESTPGTSGTGGALWFDDLVAEEVTRLLSSWFYRPEYGLALAKAHPDPAQHPNRGYDVRRIVRALRSMFSARGFAALALAPAVLMSHHQWHLHHMQHLAYVAAHKHVQVHVLPHSAAVLVARPSSAGDLSGVLTSSQVKALWTSAGGPAWAAAQADRIAVCESGRNTWAHNPSGATGLFQILGSVVPGNLYDARVNAANAVAKFRASGGSFAQWVCKG